MRGLKDNEVKARPEVCFTVIDAEQRAYLSITGHATTSYDEALLGKVWKRSDDVWWPGGPQDENVRVLRLEPRTADLWDGPASSAVAAYLASGDPRIINAALPAQRNCDRVLFRIVEFTFVKTIDAPHFSHAGCSTNVACAP